MKKGIFTTCCIISCLYLTANIVVGSYPTDKEAYESISSVKDMRELQRERNSSYMYKAQQFLLPLWRENVVIYPVLIVSCLVSGLLIRHRGT